MYVWAIGFTVMGLAVVLGMTVRDARFDDGVFAIIMTFYYVVYWVIFYLGGRGRDEGENK